MSKQKIDITESEAKKRLHSDSTVHMDSALGIDKVVDNMLDMTKDKLSKGYITADQAEVMTQALFLARQWKSPTFIQWVKIRLDISPSIDGRRVTELIQGPFSYQTEWASRQTQKDQRRI